MIPKLKNTSLLCRKINSLSPPPSDWLELHDFPEVVQRLKRVLERELILRYTLPASPIHCSNHQVVIANEFRFASGEDSGQQILYLVAVGDEQISVGTVAARLIQRHWLH
jgi:hypothetical protein